jgi:hypothetical protein
MSSPKTIQIFLPHGNPRGVRIAEIAAQELPHLSKGYQRLRQKLLEEKVLQTEGAYYRLPQDQFFKTPSGASDFVIGGSSNGWVEWKDAQGKTLDELIRRNGQENY